MKYTDEWHSFLVRGAVDGEPVSFGYRGPDIGVLYLQRFVQDGLFGTAATAIDRHAADPGDLLLAVGAKADLDEHGEPASVLLPLRLHMVIDLADDAPAAQGSTFREQAKRHRARVRRYGYAWEMADSDAEYDWFYDRMHLPTMAARHGTRARTVEREEARVTLFHQGGLLFLTSGGRRIAGVVLHLPPPGDRCHVRLTGWLDGDPQYLRQRVAASLTFFVRDWATRAGIRFLDLHGCEPFLSKGTMQTKRRQGTTASVAGEEFDGLRALLTVRRDRAAVRDFLVANPPISVDRADRMGALFFHDDRRPARTDLPWDMPGIETCRHLHVDEFLGPRATARPDPTG